MQKLLHLLCAVTQQQQAAASKFKCCHGSCCSGAEVWVNRSYQSQAHE